jgi:hypothetical protein
VFVLLLRLGGLFQRPAAAAIAGTVLCIATLGVSITAIFLANNDRCAEARAERADGSTTGEHAETVAADSSAFDTMTPTTVVTDEEDQAAPSTTTLANTPATTKAPDSLGTDVGIENLRLDVETHDDEEDNNRACVSFVACSL